MGALLPVAYLNGRYLPLDEARISPLDRGFLFGEGIYEVIPVYAGQPMKVDAHFERLARSCREIEMDNPLAGSAGPKLVARLAAENGGGDMSIYLQITRGADSAPRNHVYPEASVPTVFAMCASSDPRDDALAATGVAAITRRDTRWERCDIKTTSLIANTMLREEAKRAGAVECILLRAGLVTEGAASTVLVVRDGRVSTPRPDPQILPGTTLGLVRRLLATDGIDVVEEDVSEDALRAADEVWLCSSVRETLPVCTLDGEPVGDGRPGILWRRLDELYQAHKQAVSENHD